jgi:sugar-phosphatase
MFEITCKAILFDMDGVLIDSTPAVARVWNGWAREHGFDPEEVIKRAHGRPSIETVREYLPHADHEAENREIERREMTDLQGVKLLPGASELLHALPSGSWTIVTSSTRPLAEVRLQTAGLPVPEHIVTSNDIEKGKPDPEPYLKAASMLAVRGSDCLVAEDTPTGILAGKRAGSRVIAFRTTCADSDLAAAGADWIVDGCSSLSVDPANSRGHLVLKAAT